jgi:hypothetical protein
MGGTTGGILSESSFIVDDGLLSDLMNLDSLSERKGDDDVVESWMDGSDSCSGFYSEMSCNVENSGYAFESDLAISQTCSESALYSGSDAVDTNGGKCDFPPPLSPSPVGSGNIAMLLTDPAQTERRIPFLQSKRLSFVSLLPNHTTTRIIH